MDKKYIAFFCVLSLFANFVYAENINEEIVSKDVILYVGQVKIFPTNVPRRIAIGKPEIADVTMATNSEITVVAKSVGTTTFVYWDNTGERNFNIRVLSEDINKIKQRVDSLIKELNLPGVYTKVAETEEKILLLGEVKNAQDRERVFIVLGPLKDKVIDLIRIKEEESAIDIEVEIIELNRDATNTLGLTNPLSNTSGITLTEVGSPGIADTGAKWSNLFKVLNLSRDAFAWTLYALAQEGKARVLSRPRLTCQSGKEAELLVGGEKPTFTTEVVSTSGATGTEVEYKEYGIKLKIKPTVTEEKRIKLALNVEISEVGTVEFIGQASNRTAQAYPLTKRNVSTELLLNDGQTMAIGGLIKQKSEEDITKTPGLGDIPILGMLFRKKISKTGGGSGERGNVELFITLTPTLVSKQIPAPTQTAVPQAPQQTAPAHPTPQAAPTLKESAVPVPKEIPKETKPESPIDSYLKLVQQKILNAIYYPKQAKDAGWEGVVRMSLNISFDGQLKEIKIAQSSGYKILDDTAKEIAAKVAPYPPFPPQIDSKELWVEVPIIYKEH